MNVLKDDFNTVEEGMKILKEGISIRDRMGGALYWNIVNDDCLRIGGKLISMGADSSEVSKLLS